jgi:hypothetical protein
MLQVGVTGIEIDTRTQTDRQTDMSQKFKSLI